MNLAFIPFYIQYLGIEAYGLIGVFVVIQAWLVILEMGMTPTLNREMARFTAGAETPSSVRDLLRSFEIVSVGVAALVVACSFAGAPWVAGTWLKLQKLSVDAVSQALSIMGVVVGLRFVEAIYRSVLIGLQRQVLYNALNATLATMRGFGTLGVLLWCSPTIYAFFLWQGVVSLVSVLIFAKATYSFLPTTERVGRFSASALRRVGKFSGEMMGITLLSLMLTQVDKVLLSKLLSLQEYGYFTLASVVAGGLYVLTSPIAQAFSPVFARLHAANDEIELIRKFHQGAQCVSVVTGTVALIVINFASLILELWTRNPEIAQRSAELLVLLGLGVGLNCLQHIPYQVQLAKGWTRLSLLVNVAAVIILVPAVFWATPRYGAEGAAWVWIILNLGYLLIGAQFMFRKILTQEKYRWYLQDLLHPILASAAVSTFGAWLTPSGLNALGKVFWLLFVSSLSLLCAALAASAFRERILTQVRSLSVRGHKTS
jgi:O-antigen/teichoic acid export membrane protein